MAASIAAETVSRALEAMEAKEMPDLTPSGRVAAGLVTGSWEMTTASSSDCVETPCDGEGTSACVRPSYAST